jgi:hypothetical protein
MATQTLEREFVVARPTREERDAWAQTLADIIEHSEGVTAAAARRGVSYMVLYRQILKGDVEGVRLGRDYRVWRDDE